MPPDRQAITAADDICSGTFTWFGHHKLAAGLPPDWFYNPLEKINVAHETHWSCTSDFGQGDIKVLWDLSRFSFVYPLVRAYAHTGDEKFAAAFWQLVEDWREKNPPNTGPNWKCGQEISFRVMAWCWGLYGFAASAESTPERIARLVQMIAVSGERIAANFSYALSQRNNHGISEAMGLYTIGLLFPDLKKNTVWKRRGRKWLEKLALELIYEDGSFCQHSMVYHRLMLDDYLWVDRLAQSHDEPFPENVRQRLLKACEWLLHLMDRETGALPNYGHNDGSLILPLSACNYQDFRPVVQAGCYQFGSCKPLPPGPWDEALLWLHGPKAVAAPQKKIPLGDFAAEQGGYYLLRQGETSVFTRCANYRHRPGQTDMLHADVWWRGQNLACDAGTFSYNAPPWDYQFSGTALHNTVTVDSRDQMDRVGRFMWLPWLQDSHCSFRRGEHICLWQGGHGGYKRLQPPVHHNRAIALLPQDGVVVIDFLSSEGLHDYRLHWLLADYPCAETVPGAWQLQTPQGDYFVQVNCLSISEKVSSNAGALSRDRLSGSESLPAKTVLSDNASVGALSRGRQSGSESPPTNLASRRRRIKADEQNPFGWHAPHYWHKEPASSLLCECHGGRVVFFSYLGPQEISLDTKRSLLDAGSWQAVLAFDQKSERLVGVRLDGVYHESLHL